MNFPSKITFIYRGWQRPLLWTLDYERVNTVIFFFDQTPEGSVAAGVSSVSGSRFDRPMRWWDELFLDVWLRSFRYGAFLKWGFPPIAGWFIREYSNLKWMMTGGTPISGNHHIMTIQCTVLGLHGGHIAGLDEFGMEKSIPPNNGLPMRSGFIYPHKWAQTLFKAALMWSVHLCMAVHTLSEPKLGHGWILAKEELEFANTNFPNQTCFTKLIWFVIPVIPKAIDQTHFHW